MTHPLSSGLPGAEIIVVPPDTDEVKCDGGGGALGHPVVWYAFGKRAHVDCHYCDRRFIKQK
jgi:uncharacterized Zn-finger protein